MLSLLRSLGLASRKTFQKPSAIKPALLMLENRITPAVTALYNSSSNLLTINFQSANDTATVTYDSTNGYRINAGAINILGGYSASSQVDRLVIRDSGDSARGQKVTLGTSVTDNFSLDDGASITGIETVILSKDITVANANGVSITGATTSIQLGANISTDDRPVILDGPVALSADVTINTDDSTGANVSFTSTIDSITASPQVARDITITAGTGIVSFAGNIGSTKNLDVINFTGGDISLSGNVISSGQISFTGDLTLNRNVTISSSSGDITFNNKIDSDSSTTPRTLTLGTATPTQSGATTFGDALGGTNRLGAVTVHRTGTISIDGNISTANAAVSFKGDVALTDNSTISTKTGSNVGGNVSFQSAVNGAQDLTVDAGSNGAVSFGSTVGATTNLGEIQVTAKTIAIGGSITSNNNDITLTGGVILNSSPTIFSTGGDITLNGSVNGSAINTRSLTLNAGDGGAIVNAVLGNLRRLLAFTISNADDVNINNSITATTISITADGGTDNITTISVAGNAMLAGSTAITSTAPDETYIDVSGRFNGSVSVTGSGSIKSELKATSNSNFTVTGTDVTDRSKGTLTKTQPGRPAVITFEDINNVDLTGGTSSNVFTFKEWFNGATVNGVSGTSDTIVVDRSDATGPVDYVLGSSSLTINDSATSTLNTLNFSNIQASTLVGGPGADTFTLSNWTGKAKLVGNEDADKLIWSKAGTTTSTLTATGFTAGTLQATFNSLEEATLTSSAGTFNVNGFQGFVGTSGATVNATYNADFTLNSTASDGGIITAGGNSITFSGTSTVRLNGGIKNNAFTLSGTVYTGAVTINGDRGNDVFNLGGTYTGVVVVNGDDGNDTFNLTGSYTTGGITVNGGQGNDSYNLTGSYAGTITLRGGEGNDTYNITLPASGGSQLVTVTDSGTSSRDTINARSITSSGLLARTSTSPLTSGTIAYAATPQTFTTFPRISFSGIEIVTLL